MKSHAFCTALVVAAALSSSLVADEKDDAAKQKLAAEALWQRMEFEKAPALVDSKNFMLFSRLPEARSKALSTALEKHLVTALKGLKFDNNEKPWKGKLAVFVLPERSDFVNFMRKSQKRSPNDGEVTFGVIAGDEPMIVIGEPAQAGVKPETLATYELAQSLLKRKMGAGEPPDWVADGFARATASRAANPATKGKAFKIPNAPFSVLWSDQATAEQKSAYSAYVLDYLAYGPGNDLMASFLTAIRPGENGEVPTPEQTLKTLSGEWTVFEYYARKWTKTAAPKPATPPKKKG